MVLMSSVPRFSFSHMGMFVADAARMEDFYTRVLGFAVTDRGERVEVGVRRDEAVGFVLEAADGDARHALSSLLDHLKNSLGTLTPRLRARSSRAYFELVEKEVERRMETTLGANGILEIGSSRHTVIIAVLNDRARAVQPCHSVAA